jgi:hypothetical protein
LFFQHREVVIMGKFAESDDYFDTAKENQFPFEIAPTCCDFFSCGLVVRRSAMTGCGYISVLQPEAIVCTAAGRLIRKSCGVQDPVKDVTGAIPGKHTPGTIRAMGSGRKAKNEESGIRVAERRYRLTPVGLVTICPTLD